MKCILFCENPYAFGVLSPIRDVLQDRGHPYLWYLAGKLISDFPFPNEPHSHCIDELGAYRSDAIFVPGNEVPHFIRGVKVQVFHGLAGEKKGHFRIRHYFDLYLTQGPYFTNSFNKLKERYKNFSVIETGWSKLDSYRKYSKKFSDRRAQMVQDYGAKKILLYAPTFSPKLTSSPHLSDSLLQLAEDSDYLILIKFHDLMAEKWIDCYRHLSIRKHNVVLVEDDNIIPYLAMSDLLISDTSSVVYEFLLLDKPAITFRSRAPQSAWKDIQQACELRVAVRQQLTEDPCRQQRREVIARYHPYDDGGSSRRMVDSVEKFIEQNGVPECRELSFFRRFKINRRYA